MEALLSAQDGVVARRQLVASELVVARRRLASCRWQRIGRCYVGHNGPLTARQRAWVAVLNTGEGAALAGRTAAAAAGLTGWHDNRLHVQVQRGASSPPALNGVKVHWTRSAIALHPVAAPPRVQTPVALLQASSWSASDRAALGILAAGVQQRLVRPRDLEEARRDVPQLRRPQLVQLTLWDLAGGAQALSEIDATRLCTRHGLPHPARQAVRTDRQGRRRYLDLEWPEWRVAAEIDGLQHMEIRHWCDDLLRQNELVIARTDVLRFPSLLVRAAGDVVADQIRRALTARGWCGVNNPAPDRRRSA